MGNKLMRRMVTLLVAAAMIMTSGVFAFAASPTQGKVTSVGSVAARTGKTITVSWKADKKADKYIVKCGSMTKTVTGTSTKFTTKPGYTYKITVTPVYGKTKGTAKAGVTRFTRSTTITKATSGKKKVTLTWKKAKGATKYVVQMYKNGKWTAVKTVSGTKATIKVTKAGSYKFRVYPKKGTASGAVSAVKTGKAK